MKIKDAFITDQEEEWEQNLMKDPCYNEWSGEYDDETNKQRNERDTAEAKSPEGSDQ